MCLCFHWQGLSPHPCLKNPWINITCGKKALLFPPERKENNLSLHSHCFVAPFWVIQILIHRVCSVHESLKMTLKGFKDVSKIKCYPTALVYFRSTCIGTHILVFFNWCWHRSQINHLAVLRSRPLETLNTSLSLSPRLSFWKRLPCGSREVRRWACSTHKSLCIRTQFHLHTQNRSSWSC